jgi:hypothetical protein
VSGDVYVNLRPTVPTTKSPGAGPGCFEVPGPGVNATDDNSDWARPEGPKGWGSWEEVITLPTS